MQMWNAKVRIYYEGGSQDYLLRGPRDWMSREIYRMCTRSGVDVRGCSSVLDLKQELNDRN